MATVLVLGAAGPAGMNYVRAIAEAGHNVVPSDTDQLRLDAWYGIGTVTPPGPIDMDWLHEVVVRWEVDVVHSQPEGYVLDLAQYRPSFVLHHLPSEHDVMICQDKWETAIRWRRDGLRDDWTERDIREQSDVVAAAARCGLPFWLRAARGAGARGATEVHSVAMGVHWIKYWQERGVDWEFLAEGFLPGRDYAWTSIWHDGRLVCSTARERIQYMFPHLAPSGRTGTPVVATVVHSEAVNVMATEAVLSISDAPHGVYCVDLREDADGTPRPTEINCGRFFTTSYHTAAMGLNFPDLHVRLAMGESPPDVPEYDCLPDGATWVRHIDCPGVVAYPPYTQRREADGVHQDGVGAAPPAAS